MIEFKKWTLLPQPTREYSSQFKEFPEALVNIFYARGIKNPAEAQIFLKPDFERDCHDPFLFKNMAAAVVRIFKALESSQQIVIYGDYDADGVTGSAVIISTLKLICQTAGYSENIVSYIPHRELEGYGLRLSAVEKLAAEGANLIITVDCGISCAAEIARAKELGVDTIVVDHHEIPEIIPEAIILHPRVSDETYPFKYLAAVGVSFKLATALYAWARKLGLKIEVGAEKWLLDLVAIATVTDVVPLIGENRALEKWGLVVLRKTKRLGLKMLLEAAGIRPEKIDTTTIGFTIGPRLNAASRMEHGSLALAALMSETTEAALASVNVLNDLNKSRQKVSDSIYRAAKIMLEPTWNSPAHIVAGDGWSAGLVGLIAGKLMNESGRPTFVFGVNQGSYVGSGRSVPGCNVVIGLQLAQRHLLKFGGHPAACGLTIEGEENYQRFCEIMLAHVQASLMDSQVGPKLEITCALRLNQINWELVNLLEDCAPFGEGNPKPLFLFNQVEVEQINYVGKSGEHVRALLSQDGKTHWCVGFGLKNLFAEIPLGSKINAVVEIGSDWWNGQRKISLKMVAVKICTNNH